MADDNVLDDKAAGHHRRYHEPSVVGGDRCREEREYRQFHHPQHG